MAGLRGSGRALLVGALLAGGGFGAPAKPAAPARPATPPPAATVVKPPAYVPPGLEPASLGVEIVGQKGNVFLGKVVDMARLAKYKVAGVRPGEKVKLTVLPGRIEILTPKGKDRPPVPVVTGPAGRRKPGVPYVAPPLPTDLPAGMEAQFVALQRGSPKGTKPPASLLAPAPKAPTPKPPAPTRKPK